MASNLFPSASSVTRCAVGGHRVAGQGRLMPRNGDGRLVCAEHNGGDSFPIPSAVVPDLVGMDVATADSTITGSVFAEGAIKETGGGVSFTVAAQSPAAGETAFEGAAINIVVYD